MQKLRFRSRKSDLENLESTRRAPPEVTTLAHQIYVGAREALRVGAPYACLRSRLWSIVRDRQPSYRFPVKNATYLSPNSVDRCSDQCDDEGTAKSQQNVPDRVTDSVAERGNLTFSCLLDCGESGLRGSGTAQIPRTIAGCSLSRYRPTNAVTMFGIAEIQGAGITIGAKIREADAPSGNLDQGLRAEYAADHVRRV